MMKKVQVIGLMFCLFIVAGCNTKQEQIEDKNLTCDSILNEFESVILSSFEMDLSRLLSVVEYNDTLFLAAFLNGSIYMHDTNEDKTIAISRNGKGPFEFSNPVLYVYKDILFVYDLAQLKIAEYDLIRNEFINEFSLSKHIGGPLIHVNSNNGKKVFYFRSMKRNRSESNNTFVSIVSFEPSSNRYDTIDTYIDTSRLNYWDQNRNADHSFEASMYTHKKIGVLAGKLAVAETNKFSFNFIETNRLNVELDFNYTPNYDAYLNGLFAQIDERSQSPEYIKSVLKTAIDNRSEAFGSKFHKWISSKEYSLLSLFSKKNAHLLLNNKTFEVVCSDSTHEPVLIDDTWIYWLANTNEYEQELVRTKIETIN